MYGHFGSKTLRLFFVRPKSFCIGAVQLVPCRSITTCASRLNYIHSCPSDLQRHCAWISAVMFHSSRRHDVKTTVAVPCLPSSGSTASSSVYCRQASIPSFRRQHTTTFHRTSLLFYSSTPSLAVCRHRLKTLLLLLLLLLLLPRILIDDESMFFFRRRPTLRPTYHFVGIIFLCVNEKMSNYRTSDVHGRSLCAYPLSIGTKIDDLE